MIDFSLKKALFSLEVFPPKDSVGLNDIYASMGRFKALQPDYVSVTYGAGGSLFGNTVEIASDIQNKFGIDSVAHLVCVNSGYKEVDAVLDALEEKGVKNILALRGDRREGYAVSDFRYATDLIQYINKRGGFKVAAACYPEGHIESENMENDLDVMKMKDDLGVSHFISQLFFDNADFYRMLDAMEKRNIKAPVEAGIMPVTSAKQILRMISLSGAKLPPKLSKIIARFEYNKEALVSACINYAVDQITDLLTNGVRGIHLYAMNNPAVAEKIYGSVRPIFEDINGVR